VLGCHLQQHLAPVLKWLATACNRLGPSSCRFPLLLLPGLLLLLLLLPEGLLGGRGLRCEINLLSPAACLRLQLAPGSCGHASNLMYGQAGAANKITLE
jgi:hypothetical protein